jgi:GNAT superfamily N-acetyltransferase
VGAIVPRPPPVPRVAAAPDPDPDPDGLADPGPLSVRFAPWRPLREAPPPPPSSRQPRLRADPPSRPLPSLPAAREAEDIRALLDNPPPSERAPVSSWRPKQRYPSYAPPPEEEAPSPALPPAEPTGRAFAIKVLDSSEELVRAYRLRYQVFEALDYLRTSNRCRLEIDAYDRYAIAFGAIEIASGELVGTLRLIANGPQAFFAGRIRRILDLAGERGLRAQALERRRRAMPSIVSPAVGACLAAYNADAQEVEELSRTIVDPRYRGSGVSRGLMEFGLAYAMAAADPILIGGCLPEHVPMYAKYGYERLPGTGLDAYDTVGQVAHTVVCNTRILPEPTSSRVAAILAAMRMGEPECVLEECVREVGSRAPGVWHFGEGYHRAGGGVAVDHEGGARLAVG